MESFLVYCNILFWEKEPGVSVRVFVISFLAGGNLFNVQTQKSRK